MPRMCRVLSTLEYGARLLSTLMADRRKKGNRKDGKTCEAKPGECRYNNKYYTPDLRDEKSWSMPYSDDTCDDNCPYLMKDKKED